MIVTLATVPAVIALVTIVKDLGMPSKFGAIAAVLFGVTVQVLDALASSGQPNWYQVVAMGVILGLSAAGLYDASRVIGTKHGSGATLEEPQSITNATLF